MEYAQAPSSQIVWGLREPQTRFSGADFVKRLVHFRHDVKTIEDVKRLGAFLANDFQIGLPHIGTDEHDLRSQFVADDSEESLKGFDGSFAAHPEQAGNAEVNLINQRQVLVAFGVLDFIDADRIDLAKQPVLQPEGDDVFHRVENLFP